MKKGSLSNIVKENIRAIPAGLIVGLAGGLLSHYLGNPPVNPLLKGAGIVVLYDIVMYGFSKKDLKEIVKDNFGLGGGISLGYYLMG